MYKRTFSLGLALLPFTAHRALAHGDAHKKPAVARKEQKPWGIAGDARSVKRSIDIAMTDAMRFAPDRLTVRQGETVRLVIRNNGKMLHELVIGTRQELDEALGVTTYMGGGPSLMYAANAVAAFDEALAAAAAKPA